MKSALILALAAGSLGAPTPTIKSRQFNLGDLLAPGSGGFSNEGSGSGPDLGDLFGGSSDSPSSSPTPSSTAPGGPGGFDLSDWFPGSSSAFKKLPRRDGGLGGLGDLADLFGGSSSSSPSSTPSSSPGDDGFDLSDLFPGSSGDSDVENGLGSLFGRAASPSGISDLGSLFGGGSDSSGSSSGSSGLSGLSGLMGGGSDSSDSSDFSDSSDSSDSSTGSSGSSGSSESGSSDSSSGSSGLSGLMGGGSDSSSSSSGSSGFGSLLGGSSTSNDVTDNNGCKKVTFIFARGTTEMGNMGTVIGPKVGQELNSLTNNGCAVQGVDYPADAAGNANMGASGGPKMAELVQTALKQCPDTKVVLGGYSQGAMVVHNADKKLESGQVVGAVTFGDPFKAQKPSNIDQFKTFCASGDPVCLDGGNFMAHLSYGSNAKEAAQFLAQAAGF